MNLTPIFQVSECTEMLNAHLSRLGELVVEGEISELKVSQGKWLFVTIKDSYSSLNVFGVMFQLRNAQSLAVGMKVHVTGIPKLHQKSGRFSLQAVKIIPAGEGALKQAYDNLKNKLESEGLFDLSHKRRLPKIPMEVALLTASGSEAFNDFTKIARERFPGISISHIPITVQGDSAPDSIIQGLKKANLGNFDLLVLTRGGGSLEDLLAFNDEAVARAVFASRVPIVCAIGHEGNVTLAELTADLRASTPSNAAELSIPDINFIFESIDRSITQMSDSISQKITQYQQRTEFLAKTLNYGLKNHIGYINSKIRKMSEFARLTKHQIDHLKQINLHSLSSSQNYVQSKLSKTQFRFNQASNALRFLDSRRVLKRGYTLTRNSQGKLIESRESVRINQTITTEFHDGTIRSIINQTQPDNE